MTCDNVDTCGGWPRNCVACPEYDHYGCMCDACKKSREMIGHKLPMSHTHLEPDKKPQHADVNEPEA